MDIDNGGSAFPQPVAPRDGFEWCGLSRRDWFATFAPEPTEDAVENQVARDRLANPHGDSYKPPRRSLNEIRADLRFAHADTMIEASKRTPR